jgi:hypothetical protein
MLSMLFPGLAPMLAGREHGRATGETIEMREIIMKTETMISKRCWIAQTELRGEGDTAYDIVDASTRRSVGTRKFARDAFLDARSMGYTVDKKIERSHMVFADDQGNTKYI